MVHGETSISFCRHFNRFGALGGARFGAAIFAVDITDRQRPGDVYVPMHWSAAFAPSGMSNGLVGAHRDAVSGQPEFKHTPARVEPL